MTALPALALSLLAVTGACVPTCSPAPAALPEIGPAQDAIEATATDVRQQVDEAGPELGEPLPADPLAVLDALAAAHLPTGDEQPLPMPSPSTSEPAIDDPNAASRPSDEAPAPGVPERHIDREDPSPKAQGEAQHAPPAWPSAQGERVSAGASPMVASLLLGLAAVGLYHKLSKDGALEHPARRRILSLLAEEPGLGTTDVADELGVAYRTARHHLEVLARFDLVVCARHRERWRWARPEDAARLDEAQLPALQQRLLALLEEEPGLHLSELARRLDAAKATVKHHLDRLDEREAVEDERVGPLRRFFPVEADETA